jgi:hypothetical protein
MIVLYLIPHALCEFDIWVISKSALKVMNDYSDLAGSGFASV